MNIFENIINRENIMDEINQLLEKRSELLGEISDFETGIFQAKKEIEEIDSVVRTLNDHLDLLDGNDIICEPEE
jgi:chromosome segregation ATPase